MLQKLKMREYVFKRWLPDDTLKKMMLVTKSSLNKDFILRAVLANETQQIEWQDMNKPNSKYIVTIHQRFLLHDSPLNYQVTIMDFEPTPLPKNIQKICKQGMTIDTIIHQFILDVTKGLLATHAFHNKPYHPLTPAKIVVVLDEIEDKYRFKILPQIRFDPAKKLSEFAELYSPPKLKNDIVKIQKPSINANIWSLGVIFLEVIVGQTIKSPVESNSALELIQSKHLRDIYGAIITKMLEPNPQKRIKIEELNQAILRIKFKQENISLSIPRFKLQGVKKQTRAYQIKICLEQFSKVLLEKTSLKKQKITFVFQDMMIRTANRKLSQARMEKNLKTREIIERDLSGTIEKTLAVGRLLSVRLPNYHETRLPLIALQANVELEKKNYCSARELFKIACKIVQRCDWKKQLQAHFDLAKQSRQFQQKIKIDHDAIKERLNQQISQEEKIRLKMYLSEIENKV